MSRKQKRGLARIGAGAVLLAAAWLLPLEGWASLAAFAVPYAVVGWDVLWKAVRNILHGQVFDENFLMALATVGAFATGEYSEGVAVMLFYQIGEWFQRYAVGRSRKSITALMDIRPDHANLVGPDGTAQEVDPDEVSVGSTILVKPGERVPLDGTVLDGDSMLDTAALTGESVPRHAAAGDAVVSGCINGSGLLRVRVDKPYGESTVAKILDLVENAGEKKAKAENFITKFSRWYTPAVVIAALALAVLPPLVLGGGWAGWVHRALIFLVISCPCALVISVPLSFFGGIGGASRRGILVKGGAYMEVLANTGTVVFDKTGTLTKAQPTVREVVTFGGAQREQMLRVAACLEEHFPHSIASAVVRCAAQEGLEHEEMHSRVKYVIAHGIASEIDGRHACIGSYHFIFEDEGCVVPPGEEEKFAALPADCSLLYLALGGWLAAVLCIEDPLREESAQVVRMLRRLGVRRTVMMTGDSERTARTIAQKVGVDEYYAEVLPEDKAAFVQREKAKGHTVVMLGDGINDSPALSAADAGIAISEGAQLAREIADITISGADLYALVTLKAVSNALMRRIRANYRFVLGFNSALLALGLLGVITPGLSAGLHNLSTLGIGLHSMTNLLEEGNFGAEGRTA